MPFNSAGVFNRLYNWVTDRQNGIKIMANRNDAELDGIAAGLTNTICRDGQSTATSRIPFAQGLASGTSTSAIPALNVIGDPDTGVNFPATGNAVALTGGGADLLKVAKGVDTAPNTVVAVGDLALSGTLSGTVLFAVVDGTPTTATPVVPSSMTFKARGGASLLAITDKTPTAVGTIAAVGDLTLKGSTSGSTILSVADTVPATGGSAAIPASASVPGTLSVGTNLTVGGTFTVAGISLVDNVARGGFFQQDVAPGRSPPAWTFAPSSGFLIGMFVTSTGITSQGGKYLYVHTAAAGWVPIGDIS